MQVPSHPHAILHLAVASTFTAEPVERTLSFWLDKLDISHVIQFSPYNQVFQQLLDANSLFSQNQRNGKSNNAQDSGKKEALNVLYIRLADWLNSETDDPEGMLRQNATDLVKAIKVAALNGNAQHMVVFCPASRSITEPEQKALAETESFIAAQLQHTSFVATIPAKEIEALYRVAQFEDEHAARAGHVPYTDTFFSALATITIRRYQALKRSPAKVIVLDCDNTLWKGVCGEDGATGVVVDEGFRALQSFMLAQRDAGMLLCLASKNMPADVDAVFEQNEGMLIRKEDIVDAHVNWQPKSENIKSLAEGLNLGLDSFIFIDDNPVECAEVRAHCPQVVTLQLPQSSAEFERFLNHVWVFDRVNITDEDKVRARRYQENVKREQAKSTSTSLKDFLISLKLNIDIARPERSQYARIAQLTQRTNQFNATTIRRSESEIAELIERGQLEAVVVSVSDRFGDYGLVGVLLYGFSDTTMQIDSLMLSCRALGRGVEQAMALYAGQTAAAQNLAYVDFAFAPTERNEPVHAFLESVAPYTKREITKGVIYRYRADDLKDLVPIEAATPSAAKKSTDNLSPSIKSPNGTVGDGTNGKAPTSCHTNGSAKNTHGVNRATALNPYDRWQTIADRLYSAERILSAVRSQTIARPQLQSHYIEPQSDTEKAVVKIWQDVLGIHGIGLEDGFKELGGSSLQLAQIYGRLRVAFDTDLPFTTLFGLPNIRAFVEYLDALPDSDADIDAKAIAIQERAARQKAAMQQRKNLAGKKLEREKLQLNFR